VLLLLPADAIYYFTQPNSHRALPAHELLAKWRAIHPESIANSFSSVAEALQAARAKATPDDVIFIGGSNYVVGEAIKYSYS
ncbi:MAG: bifunctional folylpolyglutamate synthase/dihydrofolate synthase, partial [Firmicutes bacterium]|nr:bifunctional folylpolyglutamate synthase/dihydrofolate synthase [Bacillota bacterium]